MSDPIKNHILQSFLGQVGPKDVHGYYWNVVEPYIIYHMEEWGDGSLIEYTEGGLEVLAIDIYDKGRIIAGEFE